MSIKMLSQLKRFFICLSNLRNPSKYSILLFISVFTISLVFIFTSIHTNFTFKRNYKLAQLINNDEEMDNNDLDYSDAKDSEYSALLNHFSPEPDISSSDDKSETNSETTNSRQLKTNFEVTEQRLWFLMNGSFRLNASESSKLALWPEESSNPSDDRIINQLLFVPEGYDPKTTPLKSIYLSSGDDDWKVSIGRREFLKCPVSSCQLVPRSQAQSADLIFFKVYLLYKLSSYH